MSWMEDFWARAERALARRYCPVAEGARNAGLRASAATCHPERSEGSGPLGNGNHLGRGSYVAQWSRSLAALREIRASLRSGVDSSGLTTRTRLANLHACTQESPNSSTMSTRRPRHCALPTTTFHLTSAARVGHRVAGRPRKMSSISAIVERRFTQRFAMLIEQARALPPETETTSVLGTGPAARAVDRSSRFTTSEASEPRDADPARVWDDFMAVRRDLLAVVATGDGLALGAVSAPHPVLGAFSGYDWLAFVGAHAARHADQIREDAVS